MSYIIKPDMWDYYISCIPRYIDDKCGFSVEVFDIGNGMAEIVGSVTSVLDCDNPYYYDLTSEFFSNRAWNNSIEKNELFDVDKICSDVVIPSWFIEHVSGVKEMERHYRDIFCSAAQHANEMDNYSADDIVSMIVSYMNVAEETTDCNYRFIKDVVSVAVSNGNLKQKSTDCYCIYL